MSKWKVNAVSLVSKHAALRPQKRDGLVGTGKGVSLRQINNLVLRTPPAPRKKERKKERKKKAAENGNFHTPSPAICPKNLVFKLPLPFRAVQTVVPALL